MNRHKSVIWCDRKTPYNLDSNSAGPGTRDQTIWSENTGLTVFGRPTGLFGGSFTFWLSSLHYLSVLKCRPGTCKFIIFRIVFRNSTTRFWTPGKLWRCSGAYSGAHHRLHPSNPPRRPSSAGTQDPSLKKDVLLKKLNLWKATQIERNQKGVAHWTCRPATFKIINYFLFYFYLKGP